MPNPVIRNRQKGYCVDKQYPGLSMIYFVDIAGPKADQIAKFWDLAVMPPRSMIKNVPTFMINNRSYAEANIGCLVSADLGLECKVRESGAFYDPEAHVKYDKVFFLYPKYNHPRDLLDYMRDGDIVSVEAVPDPATHKPPKIPINLIEIVDKLKNPAPDARVRIQEDGLVRIYPHGLHRPEYVAINDIAPAGGAQAAANPVTSSQGGTSQGTSTQAAAVPGQSNQAAAAPGTSNQGASSQGASNQAAAAPATSDQGGSSQSQVGVTQGVSGQGSSTQVQGASSQSQVVITQGTSGQDGSTQGQGASGQVGALPSQATSQGGSLDVSRSSAVTTISIGSTGSSSTIQGGVINNDDNNTVINRPQPGRDDTGDVFVPITTSTASPTRSAPAVAGPSSAPSASGPDQAPRTPSKTRRGRGSGLLVQTPSQPSMDDFVIRTTLPSPIKHIPQNNILRQKRKAVFSGDVPPAQRASANDDAQQTQDGAGPSQPSDPAPRPGPSGTSSSSAAPRPGPSGTSSGSGINTLVPWPAPPQVPRRNTSARPMAEASLTRAQPSPECCVEHVLVEVDRDGRYNQRLAIRRKHNPEDIVREFFQRTLSCSRNDEGIGMDTTSQSLTMPALPPTPQSSTEPATTSMSAARGSSENLIVQVSDTDDSIITISSTSTTNEGTMDASSQDDDVDNDEGDDDDSHDQNEGERRGEKEKGGRRGEKEKGGHAN